MRTQDEILERIEKVKDIGWGYQADDLVDFLDYEHAKPYLKDDVTCEEWDADYHRSSRKIMLDYLPFFIEKVKNNRAFSIVRATEHYQAWLWLDGDNRWCNSLMNYKPKKQVEIVCKYLGVDRSIYD